MSKSLYSRIQSLIQVLFVCKYCGVLIIYAELKMYWLRFRRDLFSPLLLFIYSLHAKPLANFTNIFLYTKGRFHQHFKRIFCASRSPKCKSTLKTSCLFELLGSVRAKTDRKKLVIQTPEVARLFFIAGRIRNFFLGPHISQLLI